jgi:hypothetical protein
MTDPLSIIAYFHCRDCLKELPAGTSPAEYQKIQVGLTNDGFQVWCRRHDKSVTHFKLPIAFQVCTQLVDAYAAGLAAGGNIEWSDLDEVHRLALTALGRDHTS